MEPRDDADDLDPPSVGPSRRRRGLGFFPEPVVIKAAPYPEAAQPRELRGSAPPRVPQSYSSWEEWKAWNTGPASTLAHRPPPVFVRPDVVKTGFEHGADEGFGVDVQAESEESAPIHPGPAKASGSDIAGWYRSLAAKRSGDEASVKVEPPEAHAPDLPTIAASPASSPSTSQFEDIKPALPAAHEVSADDSPSVTPPTAAPAAAPAPPLRIPASEWFIRRALAKRHADVPAPSPPPPRSSSIAAMLNVAGAAARPPPRPHYMIGPENAGYARLASLGWGGGGLGRAPGDNRARTVTPEGHERSASPPPVKSEGASPQPLSSLEVEELEEEVFVPGPGRTAPVATALKLDRRGLGSRALEKKVTHTAAEIRRAARKAGREKSEQKGGKREKVKWAQKDRRERDERKRILAALNA